VIAVIFDAGIINYNRALLCRENREEETHEKIV